jgi:hypothetical protein
VEVPLVALAALAEVQVLY